MMKTVEFSIIILSNCLRKNLVVTYTQLIQEEVGEQSGCRGWMDDLHQDMMG